jgi:DNA repair protein RecN (Recombination protein N)
MLHKLLIKNYALIKETEIKFFPGYTSVTGETGAGKSVLLGALGLLLGERADLSAIPNNENKCVIEGEFDITRLKLEDVFAEFSWEYDFNTVIRREWLPTGKSRAFINDSPVQVNDLKTLGNYLLEIHSQHSALTITKSSEQLFAIDIYSGNIENLQKYQTVHKQYVKAEKELKQLQEELNQRIQEREFKQFLLEEIIQFKPENNEETQLENEIKLLNAAEDVVSICNKSGFILTDSDQSVYGLLSEIKQNTKSIASISDEFGQFHQRIDSLLTEIKELSRDFESTGAKTNPNPERLQLLEERYNKLQQLLKKHRVSTSQDLIEIATDLEQAENTTLSLENAIEQLTDQLNKTSSERIKLAQQLNERRCSVLQEFAQRIQDDLVSLEMPHVQIELQLNKTELSSTGYDSLVFLFSANLGSSLQELSKSASGGEISRVNFCIRNLIAEKKSLPTLIYDEADTGVSGQVATRIGELLRNQGKNQQVLAITHLPQVAAAGENQLFVFKSHSDNFSETKARYLAAQERELEIATMLSGNNPTESAVSAARDLIRSYTAERLK